ncbi:hypothetical protein Mapa_007624 [Marchantia paleacea]|nr:hypothetical protein Mapa_007624 [Marchantia paleacea]
MQLDHVQDGDQTHDQSQPEESVNCAISVREKVAGEWSNSSLFSRTLPILSILIIYTMFLQFQPSEPYLVPYLTRVKLISNEEVNIDIFPVGVYSTLFFTLLAAPACQFFSYRAVIIMGTFGKLATFSILFSGKSLFSMQITQVTYGLGAVADLVLSSYIFLLVPEKDYQTMTSYSQASTLISYMMAAELGQGLVNHGASLVTLLEITILSVAIACIISFFLPKEVSEAQEWGLLTIKYDRLQRQGFLEKIQETWRGRNLRLLSFWWVFGTAGFAMIPNYGTSLFDDIDSSANTNGHVLAASQGAACLGALAAAQLLLCLVYVQAAKSLSNQQFILLFSLNAVAGLLVQSGIQGVVVILQLSITKQFYVFGGYCMAVGVVFWIFCFRNYVKTGTVKLVSTDEERQVFLAG